jgi:hypothetical protein
MQRLLESFEQQRRKVLGECLIAFLIFAGITVAVILFFLRQGLPMSFIMYAAVGFFFGCGGLYYIITLDYRQEFKSILLSSILSCLNSSLEYDPKKGIDKELFMLSGIFKQPSRYISENRVQGTVGKTRILFSQVCAYAQSETQRGEGLIFNGLFLMADFNKDFHGRTIVLPDTAQNLLGSFGQTLQSLNVLRGQLIKLEDLEFEKEFVVYGTNQVETRYILSSALMERITAFQRKADSPVYLSFIGSQVFVAVSRKDNIAEPKMFSPMDFCVVADYYTQMQLMLGIVEDLNLNTRIWMKE